jgi:hypothetical protein
MLRFDVRESTSLLGSPHTARIGGMQMDVQKIYTALLTADLAAAEGWYTKLLVADRITGRWTPWCTRGRSLVFAVHAFI